MEGKGRVVPVIEIYVVSRWYGRKQLVRSFAGRRLGETQAAHFVQNQMAVQRFGGHPRTGRAIGAITREASKIFAANPTHKTIESISWLIRDTNTRSLLTRRTP